MFPKKTLLKYVLALQQSVWVHQIYNSTCTFFQTREISEKTIETLIKNQFNAIPEPTLRALALDHDKCQPPLALLQIVPKTRPEKAPESDRVEALRRSSGSLRQLVALLTKESSPPQAKVYDRLCSPRSIAKRSVDAFITPISLWDFCWWYIYSFHGLLYHQPKSQSGL